MKRYRKLPVVIEAVQLGNGPTSDVVAAEWCGGELKLETAADRKSLIPSVLITTLEGVMRADVGDWIIKGVRGEFYPCKPDIFEKTYEAAD